jgi:Spy/CpxP family protein refolding chaperone
MKTSVIEPKSAGRWTLIAAAGVAALLLAAPQAAWAGPRPDAPRMGKGMHGGGEGMRMGMDGGGMGMAGWGMHPRMLERMAGELGLTDAQRQSIRGLFDAARPAMEKRREQMRADAELMRRTQPGDRDYQAVVERVSRSAGEMASRAVSDAAQLRTQVWAVLTPEQRTKMQQLQEQRRAMREERRKNRQERMQQRRSGGQGPTPPPAPPQG